MSKVVVDFPFDVKEKELEFGEMINYLLVKYDDLEDQILGKFIDEGIKSDNVEVNEFKKILNSKIGK